MLSHDIVKAILLDLHSGHAVMTNFTFDSFSSSNYVMTLVIFTYFNSSLYSYWLLFMKLKYSEYSILYTILQYELNQDSKEGKVIADSVINTTPTAFIFVIYFLFSMFYRFM